jgi:hypothetical protein
MRNPLAAAPEGEQEDEDEGQESSEPGTGEAPEFDARRTIEYDGTRTLLESRPPQMEGEPDPDPDNDTDPVHDPEEKDTELWAVAARALFPGALRRRISEEPLSRPGPPPAAAQQDATPGAPARAPSGPRARAAAEPEERDTDVISGEFLARLSRGVAAEPPRGAGGARPLSDSVEVSGEEGEAALRLAAAERRRRSDDCSATQVVDHIPEVHPLDRECRLCGRRIAAPRLQRLRGAPQSERGFRCETCGNDFCAAHVKRVSGLFRSLLWGARFRCLLCMPEAAPPRRG